MRAREKFKKYGRVNRKVAPNSEGPESCKTANRGEVGRSSGNYSEERSDPNRKVESHFPSENIAAKAPEHGTKEQTDILRER